MVSVVILGGGNLAYHLTNNLLYSNTISIIQVYNRTLSKIEYLKNKTEITASLEQIKQADLYIIATSDEAIATISSKIPFNNSLVVHTSGAISISEIKGNNRKGVLYPVQSFSLKSTPDFRSIPICIEAETEKDLDLLQNISRFLTYNVHILNSENRLQLHLSAVFVNNFVNHLYKIGYDICKHNNISFELLKPIILETARKLNENTPFEAQTGPAKRNDTITMEKHLKMLHTNQKEIYTLLSNSILKTYE